MKRISLFLMASMMLAALSVRADEGMWLMMFLNKNINDMHAHGLKMSAEDIYSINHSSMKDAIIQFGGGCTGEIVSKDGLVFTNHHCGYSYIQAHSTVEHDYLKDGFWAMSRAEELPNPGLTARFLVRMEDVSDRILSEVNEDMTETEREQKIAELIKTIAKETKGDSHYEISIKPFFDGNAYYMFVYEVFRDVRLVGTPPSSIGKFGADTDNWMWPRHTGDFSVFRVYMGKDGKPADYSEDNIPLKPKHYLPISLKGVEVGDYAMICGFPGSTDRYTTSFAIEQTLIPENAIRVKARTMQLDIMHSFMEKDPKINIQYASKYSQQANYWKYSIGQNKQLQRNHVAEKKAIDEQAFEKWAASRPLYKNVLNNLRQAVAKESEMTPFKTYFFECIWQGNEILRTARNYDFYVQAMAEKNDADAERLLSVLKSRLDDYFKDYDANVDKALFTAMLKMFYEDVPQNQQPADFLKLVKKYKADFNKLADDCFAKSMFASREKMDKFFEKPNVNAIKKDMAYQIGVSLVNNYFAQTGADEANAEALAKNTRLYMKGMMEMNPNKNYYPNANLTMRLTYGNVKDYYPADAVHYDVVTTIDGIMEKEDPNNWEFVVPAKLKELYNAKDYGQYADKNGNLPVCFLSTNDITGGNSGSPIINANGHLIGLAFDGNWEAMSGDIAFEPNLQRTINVDVRYVLFVIDKYAGAGHLLKEMTIVR